MKSDYIIQNKNKLILYEINGLQKGLEELKEQTEFKIYFTKVKYYYSQKNKITLNQIYEQCVILKLNLQGLYLFQDEVDEILESLPHFKNLQQFSFKFPGSKDQNIETLLENTANIRSVKIILKKVEKIEITQNVTKPIKIEHLGLNLASANYANQDQKCIFEDYIKNQTSMKTFKVKINSSNFFNLFQMVPKETQILLNLTDSKVNMQFCQSLITFLLENKLENIYINKGPIFIGRFLNHNGIKLTDIYKEQEYDLNLVKYFTIKDLQFMRDLPYFKNIIKDCFPKTFVVEGRKKQINGICEYLIEPLDQYYQSMEICIQNITIRKSNNVWILDIDQIGDQFEILNVFQQSVKISLQLNYFNENVKQKTIQILKKLKQSKYLISYDIFKVGSYYNSLHNTYRNYFFNLLDQQKKILLEISQIKLSYFAYLKHIFDLIPIPYQIFYDLYDNS